MSDVGMQVLEYSGHLYPCKQCGDVVPVFVK